MMLQEGVNFVQTTRSAARQRRHRCLRTEDAIPAATIQKLRASISICHWIDSSFESVWDCDEQKHRHHHALRQSTKARSKHENADDGAGHIGYHPHG